MMTKATAAMILDHVRQMQGIAVRLIDQFPAEEFDARPIKNMRSPKELIVHTYLSSLKTCAEGVLSGEIVDSESTEKAACASIKTKAELATFVNDCWQKTTRAIESATDTQWNAIVKTPWGVSFPGFVVINIVRDELTHHRGQLYAYARALGHDVPMMWDFEHNAPEFQPKPQPANA